MGNTKAQTVWLYHFTNIENLSTIIQNGLMCDSLLEEGKYINSGDSSIKARRKGIPVPFGGYVANYVPFYFAARSPMLYRQHYTGTIENEHIVYLISSTEIFVSSKTPWCCSNMNAACNDAEFFNTVEEMNTHIKWDYINSRYWCNTDEHPRRREYRMAEFLVWNKIPWADIPYLAVFNDAASERVKKILPEGSKQRIFVKQDMYF